MPSLADAASVGGVKKDCAARRWAPRSRRSHLQMEGMSTSNQEECNVQHSPLLMIGGHGRSDTLKLVKGVDVFPRRVSLFCRAQFKSRRFTTRDSRLSVLACAAARRRTNSLFFTQNTRGRRLYRTCSTTGDERGSPLMNSDCKMSM